MLSVRKHRQSRSQDHQVSLTIQSRIAFSLSSHLDLNDLHSLSLTCRSIYRSLSQYSTRLKSNSLRCSFDRDPLLSELVNAQLAAHEAEGHSSTQASSTSVSESFRLPFRSFYSLGATPAVGWSGSKICACARDLVAECRKCGTIVCRNCASKPPSDRYLKERHRRLCQKCLRVPLIAHLQPLHPSSDDSAHDTPPVSSASSTRSARSESGSSADPADFIDLTVADTSAFTSSAFLREECTCTVRGVFLCLTCGHNLRASDTTYKRVWTWRSRYSTHIGGGLGTGLGVGDQGQKCGRGDHCLDDGANSVSWVEIDCSESHGSDEVGEHEHLATSRSATPGLDGQGNGTTNNRPGYLQQEIEGIGGVVKKKVRKRVKVGATVWEFEDERKDPRKYLEREASGKERSWCGWCGRVCPGERDQEVEG